MFKAVWLALGAVLLVAALAPAQTAGPANGYRIGPKDLLDIRVQEAQELNVERRVSDAGTINLPYLEEVQVSGLTENDAAAKIKTLLEKQLLQRASVTIQVKEFRSRPIAVIGSVNQPGNLPFGGRWTLLEAITAAGGLAANHGNSVFVVRRPDNGLSDQVEVSIDDLVVRADPKVNIPIFPNDVINVPGTVEVTVYFLGEVSQPGALTFKSTERITLLTAVARAGGLSERASRSILIRRTDRSGKQQDIRADYKRILSGKDPDVALQSGDVIYVKESFF
jgi:polysaccharide export outer membrane protein